MPGSPTLLRWPRKRPDAFPPSDFFSVFLSERFHYWGLAASGRWCSLRFLVACCRGKFQGRIAMQHPWWSPVEEFTRHILIYSTLLSLFVLAALYGSAINALLESSIASKFVLHVVLALEYAIVVCDAIVIMIYMISDVLKGVRRLMR
jgi:hypothetical protein